MGVQGATLSVGIESRLTEVLVGVCVCVTRCCSASLTNAPHRLASTGQRDFEWGGGYYCGAALFVHLLLHSCS